MSVSTKRSVNSPYSPKKSVKSPAKTQFSPMKTATSESGSSKIISFCDASMKVIPPINESGRYSELRLIGTKLTSFDGMKPMSSLEVLRIDNSRIASFYGAYPQPSLKLFTLKGSPLSLFDFYPIMARIVFGRTLEIVGPRPLTGQEKATAKRLSNCLFNWLIDGWLLTAIDPIHIYNPVTQARKILFVSNDFTPVPMSPTCSPMKSIRTCPPAPPTTRLTDDTPTKKKQPQNQNLDSNQYEAVQEGDHIALYETNNDNDNNENVNVNANENDINEEEEIVLLDDGENNDEFNNIDENHEEEEETDTNLDQNEQEGDDDIGIDIDNLIDSEGKDDDDI